MFAKIFQLCLNTVLHLMNLEQKNVKESVL